MPANSSLIQHVILHHFSWLLLTSCRNWTPWSARRRPRFAAAGDAAALEAARIEFLGAKSGRLKAVQKGLGQVDKADKPAAGKRFNEVKQAIEAAYEAADAAAGRRGGSGGRRPAVRSHGARRPSAAGPSAPDHADDRRVEGDHGPAGVQRGRRAGSGRPLAQLRGAEHPARASRPRPAGKLLSRADRGQGSGVRSRVEVHERHELVDVSCPLTPVP